MLKLEGKTAIITGAGDGIGKAIAHACAREGASVVVNDSAVDRATAVADEITGFGGIAAVAGFAVGTSEAARSICDVADELTGRVDILVNNAGINGDSPLESITDAQVARSLEVNLAGPIYLAREVVSRFMIAQDSGRIINMTSRSGLRGKPGESIYGATKAAQAGIALAWSKELMRYRITVNAVAPAAWTRLLEIMPEPERTNTIEKRADNVLRRVATPEDVAPTIVFLASDDAYYLTGQIIEATGQPMSLL